MAQQTAVEWLYTKLSTCTSDEMVGNINNWFEQAKQMEKEQIIRARQDGLDNGFSNGSWDSNLYYNETYSK